MSLRNHDGWLKLEKEVNVEVLVNAVPKLPTVLLPDLLVSTSMSLGENPYVRI